MAYRYRSPLTRADVTPKQMYMNRRQLMAGSTAMLGAGLIGGRAAAQEALARLAVAYELSPAVETPA